MEFTKSEYENGTTYVIKVKKMKAKEIWKVIDTK